MTTQAMTFQSTETKTFALTQIILASLFIALCASIRIPLPFTPVPLSLQSFAVMLVGCSLGSKKGALAVLVYLAEAMLGLPVLSGWRIDPFFLMTPVAGYLIGFVGQAYICGYVTENSKSLGSVATVGGYFLASFVTLACGAIGLSMFVGANNALPLGVLPFLPGDVLKVFAATAILKVCDQQKTFNR